MGGDRLYQTMKAISWGEITTITTNTITKPHVEGSETNTIIKSQRLQNGKDHHPYFLEVSVCINFPAALFSMYSAPFS